MKISTLVLFLSLLVTVFPAAFASDREDFPGRRQGGGTWNSEPVPVKVEKI